jgi:mycofactocin system glycosyltransferase
MNPTVKGSFHLKLGTRLIPGERGGIVFRLKPLRALRVNASAFDLLLRCGNGLSLDDKCFDNSTQLESALRLLDRLCQTGLLEWRPPHGAFDPFVSIVVAVCNRAGEIGSCIESLLSLNYPRLKYEIIVVDDASEDGTFTVASQYDVKVIRQEQNLGQSAARNVGVTEARGEIVAFIDSDCIAESEWLRELVPFFQDSRNALVGGYVASYFRDSVLDRYEAAKSPLNMGEDMLTGCGEESDFYVPTCNMLVRRDAYLQTGGLNENLRVGEDVDFCWKLKENGYRLVYLPKGRVRHKHRNRFAQTFKRRFEYGTSEPDLYARHKAIYKHYPLQPGSMAIFFLCAWGLLVRQPLFALAAAPIFLCDVISKQRLYGKLIGIPLTFNIVLRATARRHLELLYHLSSHLIRYYLVLMILLGLVFIPIIPVVVALILLPSISEFFRKKPRLSFPAFLILFLTDQASYQAGVFWGCVKQRSFRSLRLVFATSGPTRRTSILGKIRAILGAAEKSPVISR